MTEWNAPEYARLSKLQATMAEEAIALLNFTGNESILDVGCGNGKITAQIAARVPKGEVVGVDASADMVSFAAAQADSALQPNLRFAVADARHLPFKDEFDQVVSFNALHWIPEQSLALQSIRAALRSGGQAQLRLVPKGSRRSLEDVIEETRLSTRWNSYFKGFHDPYLHLTSAQYAGLAENCGFQILNTRVGDKAWDFQSRSAFLAFGSVTFVEWTQHLPDASRIEFVADVLDRYQKVVPDSPEGDNVFRFYQMDITLLAK
jgi:trans-aconitate 2-methyltransferase